MFLYHLVAFVCCHIALNIKYNSDTEAKTQRHNEVGTLYWLTTHTHPQLVDSTDMEVSDK